MLEYLLPAGRPLTIQRLDNADTFLGADTRNVDARGGPVS